MHGRGWEQIELMETFTILERDVRWLHSRLTFTQNGEVICHKGWAKGSLMGEYKAEYRQYVVGQHPIGHGQGSGQCVEWKNACS